jgi:3-oxoacyl-[acyl-carrier protein] reductase/pteridine reductase
MLTRALAVAFAPHITVNSVAPGVIPFAEAAEERIQALVSKTPAGRAGTGEEIAEAVLHFLTASPFTTGQVLAVDGGLSIAGTVMSYEPKRLTTQDENGEQ